MKHSLNLHPLAAGVAAALIIFASPAALAQDDAPAKEDQSAAENEIEQVVVTGSRIEQSIEDVAGSISVMTSADIDTMLVADMSQMFIYEPGVNITGSNGTAQNFIVRGMGGDRVMMIKDGMRMNEGYGANGANDVVGRGFLDVDTIKQVEVAKGAVSSLYGSDALGGIVAFTTKDAADYLEARNTHFEVNGEYEGSSDSWGAGALAAFRTGGWETLLSYKHRDGHETQNYTDERQNANIDSDSLLAKTDYIIDDNQKLTFTVDLWEQNVDRPDTGADHGNYQGLGGWTINEIVSSEEKKNHSYSARYQNSDMGLSFMDYLNTNLYFNDTEQTSEFAQNFETPPPFGPGGSRDQIRSDLFSQETWGLSASAAKELGDGISHTLSYGFDWDTTETERPIRLLEVVSDGTIRTDEMTAPFPKNDTDRLGIYLQDSIELTGRFTLVPGLRYDYYSMDPQDDPNYDETLGGADVPTEKISDSNVSWRLGALYDLTEDMTAYFQYSQGFKVPPYDLAYFYYDHLSFSGGGIRIIPANDLVPEESDSYEIGLRGAFGDFSYNVSYYYSDYSNFIQIAYLGTIDEINNDFGFPLPVTVDVFQYQNIDDARISGLEFRFDYRLTDNWLFLLNGEYMDSEDKSTGDQLSTIQPFNMTLGANYVRGSWGFDAMLRWVDDMNDVPEGAFTNDSYTVVDLYARYNLSDRLLLSVGLLNAFDEEYIEYSSIAGIIDDGRDLTLYTEPGRTVSARLRFAF